MFCSSVPPLNPKHSWCVAQNSEAKEDDNTQVHIFYSLHDPMSHYNCHIPELLGKRIQGCFHGCWAVLSSNHPRDVMWSLWNPFTSQIINLPPLSEEDYDDITYDCCLSAPPDHLNSVLLLTRTNKPRGLVGQKYAIRRNHSVLLVEFDIVVDPKYKNLVITLLPVLEFQCLKYKTWTSTSFSGVYVFKLDMDNMRWEELGDLKETILSVQLPTTSSTFYSPATASSELGGTNHVSPWAMLECTRQEKKGDMEDGILVQSVKGNQQVESHLPNFQFPGLTMNEFCVGLVENNNRLESENTDSKQEGDKDVNILVRQVKGDEDESHLLNLPLHVLGMIMEFSVGIDYLRFRSTCKSCHLASPVIPWNNRKASKRLQKYSLPSPWLIVFDKHKGIITLTDPMFGDKYFIKTPQELISDLEIKGLSFHCYVIQKSSVSQHHPPDCMVFGIAYAHYYYNVYIHFVGGKPSWRRIPFDIDDYYHFSSLTLYGRDLYALRDEIGLYMFKEVGGDCSWEPAKTPTSCRTSFLRSSLLSCDQHLLHVIVGKFGESVEVFKLKKSEEWVKIDSLGKHVIFICGTSSFCIDAKKPHMENKIYFPRLPADNENMNDILFYSLETCRYHTFNNKNFQESFGDFFGTKHFLAPHAWIEPTWS
ncbi:Toll/interleukin-1 receptor domain-containing protein [Tanacetum coccineum]